VLSRGPVPVAGTVVPVGCVFTPQIADGVTVNVQTNHWRVKDNAVSTSTPIYTFKSVKALPPLPPPVNLRLAQQLRDIADQIAAGKPLE
jgi:hypothetical protein